jgi:hypothetical protein
LLSQCAAALEEFRAESGAGERDTSSLEFVARVPPSAVLLGQ